MICLGTVFILDSLSSLPKKKTKSNPNRYYSVGELLMGINSILWGVVFIAYRFDLLERDFFRIFPISSLGLILAGFISKDHPPGFLTLKKTAAGIGILSIILMGMIFRLTNAA